MLSNLTALILPLFLSVSAWGQFASEGRSRSSCTIRYRIEVKNGALLAINSGEATLECDYPIYSSQGRITVFAFNREPWPPSLLPYIEEGSVTAFDPNISSRSFQQSLLTSTLTGAPPQVPTFGNTEILFSSVLNAQGVYRSEMSAVIFRGSREGFALKRGFQDWILYSVSAGAEYNAKRIAFEERCELPSISIEDISTCFYSVGN